MADVSVMPAGASAAIEQGTLPTADPRKRSGLAAPEIAVALLVAAVLPISGIRLSGSPGFLPAMLAVVVCFDLLCALFLIRQFRDVGDRRALALSWAYVASLVLVLGYAAAFPGVISSYPPLGHNPSAAPWLWVLWHTVFPCLLPCACAPWPARWQQPVRADDRRRLAWLCSAVAAAGGAALVGIVVFYGSHLPVLIQGLDTRRMSEIAGPVMLPIVIAATVVTVVGAHRFRGPERWAALAATAALGDVVLTIFSTYRFSLGWYAGRTLTMVSAAVVLVALVADFGRIKRRLTEEGERLRKVLARTDALEQLQRTLLGHMPDGVIMQRRCGEVAATNPAAQRLVGLTSDQMTQQAPAPESWQLLGPDGNPLRTPDPATRTRETGLPLRDQIVGVRGDKTVRWLSVNTMATRDAEGEVDYVISSINDVTERHAVELAASRHRRDARDRVKAVLACSSLDIAFQPIVDLADGRVVGYEALARFADLPVRSPDVWFAEAAEVGLGVELELAAINAAMDRIDRLPPDAYLSLNISPCTLLVADLSDTMQRVCGERVVLEMTEHASVDDYPALEAALQPLRRCGVRVAVDDAGAGFASLRHILQLQPEIIKLDLALTNGIHADPARRALAAALLSFSDDMNAVLVAEGIETAAELDALKSLGIRYGQGYLLGRPELLPRLASSADHRDGPLEALAG